MSRRVRSDLQGGRHWIRHHGVHRLLRQIDPYPNVSDPDTWKYLEVNV